jgi:hypothetical protein
MNNQIRKATIHVTTALTPLAVVLAICVGQAAQASGSGDYNYDQRGSYSYRNGADNTHCSIGYGCK